MSMDDPGWDSPGFDDESAPSGWNEPTAPAPARPGGGSGGPGGTPPWQNPKYLGIAGGAVALIVIIVLIVLVAGGGGGSSTPTTNPTPSIAAATTTPSAPSPATPSVSPTPVKTAKPPAVETVDQYDKKADHVCTKYRPKLVHAEHTSIRKFVKVADAEFKTIKALKKPPQGAEDITRWLTDSHAAIKDVAAKNINAYNASILHADTIAGELGMHICNYGH
jgi:hypothetical protein